MGVDNFKYLGVTLDTKLLYTNHVETISKRAMMTLAQCRHQIGRNWGPTHFLSTNGLRRCP